MAANLLTAVSAALAVWVVAGLLVEAPLTHAEEVPLGVLLGIIIGVAARLLRRWLLS